jgi:hypothetical protein
MVKDDKIEGKCSTKCRGDAYVKEALSASGANEGFPPRHLKTGAMILG